MGLSSYVQAFPLISSLILCYVSYGNGQVFTVHPANFTPGYNPSLELNCNIKSLMHAVTQVFVLQIDKEEGGNLVPLATVSPAGVILNSLNPGGRLSANGTIISSGDGPYLNLTIDHPDENDDGHYVCVASITDKTMNLAKLTYDLSVTKQELTDRELTNLVFTLSKKLDRVETVNTILANNIAILEQQNSDLLQNMTCTSVENNTLYTNYSALELRLQTLEQELEQERMENNGSDSEVLTKITDLENQISVLNVSSGPVIMTPNCSCCNEYADIANDVLQLQMNQSYLLQSFQDSMTNQTSFESDLLNFTFRLDSALLRVDGLENLTASQDSELSYLQDSLMKLQEEPQVFRATHPSYAAQYPVETITGDVGDLTFISVELDNHRVYNKSEGQLTITKSGHYMISITISLNMVTASAIEAGVKVNGQFICSVATSSTGILNSGSTTVIVDLAIGDKVKAAISKVIAQPVTLNSALSSLSVLYVG